MAKRLFTRGCWRLRRADAIAYLSLLLFFCAFFPQGLFGGRYVLTGDALFYSYPLRTVAWRMLRAGQLPLWTPYIFSGYPLLSLAQLGLGYPLTWGYLFLPGHVAEQVYVLAPFLLAPAFTYGYLRRLGRTPLAALLGALTFGYGGMMASPLAGNGLMTNACMWLPLCLIAVERARRGPLLNALLLCTGAYALSVLTGCGQGFLYVGLLVAAYALFLVFVPATRGGSVRAPLTSVERWRPAFVAGGACLLAAGVAAFQILETERVVRQSIRRTLSYEIFTQGAFTPAMLWKSLHTPLIYGFDMSAYVPPLSFALMLVAVGAHARNRRTRDPRVFFWLAVAVTACVLMLGQHTPLYRVVYHLPLINRFRVPSRHAFEWTFALGVLAAYGWDALAPGLRRRRAARGPSRALTLYAALTLLAAGLVVGALWWLRVQMLPLAPTPGALKPTTAYRLWKGAFVLLTLGALWRAALVARPRWRFGVLLAVVLVLCYVEPAALVARWWGRTNFTAERFTAMSDATRYLRQFPPDEGRVYTRVELFSEQFDAPPRFDAANVSAVWGLHNVAGYEPLILERYSRALGGVGMDTLRTPERYQLKTALFTARSRVLDILNTAYVVAYTNLATAPGSAARMEVSDAWQPVYEQRDTLILRNTRACPRAWLVAEAEAVDGEEALRRIRGESPREFDPRRMALVEAAPGELPSLPGGELAPESTARIVSYEPNRLVLETEAATPTVLVVSEINYPGWVAVIDGQPAPILPTDYLLRGVALPAGQHKVEMHYTVPAARGGAIISVCTLLLLGAMAGYARWGRRLLVLTKFRRRR